MYTFADEFIETALQSERIEICGRNLMVRNLFKSFLQESQEKPSLLVLSSVGGGRVLSFIKDGEEDEAPIGWCVAAEKRKKLSAQLKEFDCNGQFVIMTLDDVSIAEHLQGLLSGALSCFDENDQENGRILKALDIVQHAISVCDADAHILYANQRYWEDYHINVEDKPLGMSILDISDKFGVYFRSFEPTETGSYKMFDVIKNGEEAIDWEVRVEYTKTGEAPQLISNDMYPIKDEQGDVTGMVEITHSRQRDLKTVRNIVGLSAEYTFADIVGSSSQMQQKIHIAKEYAKSDYTILITGESGVGKELFAQSIHNFSPKRKGPFVALNCANFPENLIESELFGYVAGAFTGASKKGGIGKFELANHGTLFLDEIGELPYHFQSKLLRVLETMTITRIGSNQRIPIDVRIIAATNRDLREMVKNGLFREDLFFRLGVLNVDVPPLRDRKEDLIELSNALLLQAKDPNADKPKSISKEAENVLKAYDWPGNVRELKNVLSRASILSRGDEITADVLKRCLDLGQAQEPLLFGGEGSSSSRKDALTYDDAYREYLLGIAAEAGDEDDEKLSIEIQESQRKLYEILINIALEHTNGNKKRAAEILQISRKTLYNIINREQLDV